MSPFGSSCFPQPDVYSQPFDLVGPLFSYSYELLFPQPLSFDNDLSCPGGDPREMPGLSFTRTNSIASYHIHVSQAFSCDYALFCATGNHLPHCFQSFVHSFVVNRGGGLSSALQPPAKRQEGTQARALFAIPINFAPTTRRRPWRSCPPLPPLCCTRRKPSGAS